MNLPELPPAARAAFYQQVWRIVRQVPPGRVATYGQVAALIPPPPGIDPEEYAAHRARWAGNAMAACPPDGILFHTSVGSIEEAEALIPMTDVEGRRLNAKQQAEAKRKIAELEAPAPSRPASPYAPPRPR